MSEDDKIEGLFKRLKNIKSKNEDQSKKQLDAIKIINISSKPLKTIGFKSILRNEAKNFIIKILRYKKQKIINKSYKYQ